MSEACDFRSMVSRAVSFSLFEYIRRFLMASFLLQTSIYDVGFAKSCEDGLESSRGYESIICIYVCCAFMDGLMVIWSSRCCGFELE